MASRQPIYSGQLDGKRAASLNRGDLLGYLKTTPEGLSSNEVHKRMAFYGKNTIEDKKQNVILKFFSYFWGPIAWMIEIAAILSAIVHHTEDLIIILVLLIFNAAVGFWQEYQASNAIEQLKRRLALKTRVKRDGKWITTDAEQLVPGDIVTISLGDVVPADIILLSGGYLSID